MVRHDLPLPGTFTQLVGFIEAQVQPFAQMWPAYWLKAAAVREDGAWHLCQFSLVGRWTDAQPIKPLRDRGDALVMLSALYPADAVLQLLAELARDGHVTLFPDITAEAPQITLTQIGAYWQGPIPSPADDDLADVLEPTEWRYLHLAYSEQRFDANDFQRRARLEQAIQPDLMRRNVSSFAALVALRFARGRQQPNQYGLDRFGYGFDLPLALVVEHGPLDRKAGTLQLTIRTRRPLVPEELQATMGEFWSSDAPPLPVKTEVKGTDGWSFSNVTVPYDCGGISVHSPLLDNWLPHKVVAPSPVEQARGALSRLYTRAAHELTSTGETRWQRDLLHTQRGARFEVALANALARLGIPLLFGGQVERGDGLGGPATPGVDLVALDPVARRATAISLKATSGSPSDNEIQAVLEAADALASELTSWIVIGVLACRAPRARLGRFLARDDVRVWCREDLDFIAAAERAEAIRDLLWRPPWISIEDGWHYFLGYVPQVGY